MTAESFGTRIFTVAVKTETMLRRTHGREKSFLALRQIKANGIEPRQTATRYCRQALDWSCQRTQFGDAPLARSIIT